MCGIVGFWTKGHIDGDLEQILHAMNDKIQHRGPDSDGIWVDYETGIALGHRRLAIVDLSPTGYQPMASSTERYMTVFNGEIYNFLYLRDALLKEDPSITFKGKSDTEIMLTCFDRWGIEASLQRFTGMYGMALWDRKDQSLYLIRDRMGEKPVYYGYVGNTLLFGSDLGSFSEFPAWHPTVNLHALGQFMRYGYVPTPYTIYEGIFKLPPATFIKFPSNKSGNLPEPIAYWSAKSTVESWKNNLFEGDENEALDELDKRLSQAVGDQMISDVPLGAFLSGGIDSSTIVALMQKQSTQPVKTFSIGFEDAEYNEAHHAKLVAQHLGTEHTEVYLTENDALDVIPLLPDLYTEPFADPSQIPTYLVSKVARQDVTVALSGDAGDELFVGYDRYFRTARVYDKLRRIPNWLQSVGATTVQQIPNSAWQVVGSLLNTPVQQGKPSRVQKLQKWANLLPIANIEELYHLQFIHPENSVIGVSTPLTSFKGEVASVKTMDAYHNMTYLDLVNYLSDDILTKVDRASMGVALEVRVPMLNHEIVEFAYTIPTSMKVRNNQGKWLLRQLLYRYVPQAIVDRPKQGFGVPIESWLRNQMKDWAQSLLDKTRLQQEGFFDADLVSEKWDNHLSGAENNQYFLWNVIMFQQWQETHLR